MKVVKELIVAFKLYWLLGRYYYVSIKRMKWIMKMLENHEKYCDCDFVMEATRSMYQELFEHLCRVKGEMSSGGS